MKISQGQYGKAERGQVIPTISTLLKASRTFGVSINKLIYGADYVDGDYNLSVKDQELINRFNTIGKLSDESISLAVKMLDLIIVEQQVKDINAKLQGENKK